MFDLKAMNVIHICATTQTTKMQILTVCTFYIVSTAQLSVFSLQIESYKVFFKKYYVDQYILLKAIGFIDYRRKKFCKIVIVIISKGFIIRQLLHTCCPKSTICHTVFFHLIYSVCLMTNSVSFLLCSVVCHCSNHLQASADL